MRKLSTYTQQSLSSNTDEEKSVLTLSLGAVDLFIFFILKIFTSIFTIFHVGRRFVSWPSFHVLRGSAGRRFVVVRRPVRLENFKYEEIFALFLPQQYLLTNNNISMIQHITI